MPTTNTLMYTACSATTYGASDASVSAGTVGGDTTGDNLAHTLSVPVPKHAIFELHHVNGIRAARFHPLDQVV